MPGKEPTGTENSGYSQPGIGSPCGDKGEVVTMAKILEIINAGDRFTDDDVRTCFWVFADGLNGDPARKPEFDEVLRVMKDARPNAHERIMFNAGKILATKQPG